MSTTDLRAALGSLRRTPLFTLIAVVTLALGIGANTAAFSMINALILKPLPYPERERLERIYRATAQNSRGNVSPADYLDLVRDVTSYGAIAAYAVSDVSIAEPGQPARMAPGLRVSANLFATLGAGPSQGRSFTPDDAIAGRHRVLIISHRFWQMQLGGRDVLGRVMRVDGAPHEIVGVLPESLNDWRHLGPFDLFRPLAFGERERQDRGTTSLRLVGRRTSADGVRALEDFGRRLAREYPAVNAGASWRTEDLRAAGMPENAPGVLGMLIALSAIVLLIACSNLANLLLARTMGRAREFAVRASIGASRARLLRPLIIEGALLASAGWAGALYVAAAVNAWLNSLAAPGHPLVFGLHWPVLGWGLAAAVFTVLAFGAAPALFALRLDIVAVLKSGSRGSTVSRGHQRFRHALVVGQFVFATVLLAGAVMFARGLRDLNARHFGWDPAPVISASVPLPAQHHRVALERLSNLPGASSASLSYVLPFLGLGETRTLIVNGRERPEPGREPVAAINGVSPRYFETVGTRIVSGRAFTDADTRESRRVFIINQGMASGLFPGEDPIGKMIARAGSTAPEWGEIVGVAGDVESAAPERRPIAYQLYLPLAQEPRSALHIAVRASGVAPSALADGMAATIASLDPDLALRRLQPAETSIAGAQRYAWLIGRMLSLLALLGAGLAALGIYGVISRTVTQRTSEFGIRLALGATPANIISLVLAAAARLAAIGLALGVAGAFGVTRAIAAGWPGMRTNSAAVLAAVTLLLLVVALVASFVPARRAASTRPTLALRAE